MKMCERKCDSKAKDVICPMLLVASNEMTVNVQEREDVVHAASSAQRVAGGSSDSLRGGPRRHRSVLPA